MIDYLIGCYIPYNVSTRDSNYNENILQLFGIGIDVSITHIHFWNCRPLVQLLQESASVSTFESSTEERETGAS